MKSLFKKIIIIAALIFLGWLINKSIYWIKQEEIFNKNPQPLVEYDFAGSNVGEE